MNSPKRVVLKTSPRARKCKGVIIPRTRETPSTRYIARRARRISLGDEKFPSRTQREGEREEERRPAENLCPAIQPLSVTRSRSLSLDKFVALMGKW